MTGKEFLQRLKQMRDGDYITIVKFDGIFYCNGEKLDIDA